MKWLAQYTIYSDGVDLVAVQELDGRKRRVLKPVEFAIEDLEANQVIPAPTMSLPYGEAQTLLQALWDAGLRPNDGSGSGAEAKALRDHVKFAERMADGLLDQLVKTSEHQK